MCNIKLAMLMLVFSHLAASAQFYTITRESEISSPERRMIQYIIEIKQDSLMGSYAEDTVEVKLNPKKNLASDSLKGQKSQGYKLPLQNKKGVEDFPREALPELTIPNLIAEIRKNNIKYPKIVLAQAILETGWFKSSVCRNKHNLFGLTNPRTGKYYEFNHWTESVKAYYTKVQYRYNGGNYLLWLDKIGYAEEKTYIRALIKVLKQL
ncbi:MAG: N-acetylmuramoyl-L-alanine amidase [Bacteroides sp.]|nr:N-acetylmuramoyl-L-alanine amidase [Bacteroides sp.]